MAPPKHATRGQQPLIGELGAHFASPKKRRLPAKKQRLVDSFAMQAKVEGLRRKMRALEERSKAKAEASTAQPPAEPPSETVPDDPQDLLKPHAIQDDDQGDGTPIDVCPPPDLEAGQDLFLDSAPAPAPPRPKRLLPTETDERLYDRWTELLPRLIAPYLHYSRNMAGKEWSGLPEKLHKPICQSPDSCSVVQHTITALLFASSRKLTVAVCDCHSLPYVLLMNGLFPSAPMHARTAFSVELLDLFLAITERSSDAVTSLARALNNTYRARGFRAVDNKGNPVKEPYRKTLGYALRWYDCLHVELDRQKESAIAKKFRFNETTNTAPGTAPAPNPTALTSTQPDAQKQLHDGSGTAPASNPTVSTSTTVPTQADGRKNPRVWMEEVEDEDVAASLRRADVDLFLLDKCPACFGLKEWGVPLAAGGDIHVAVDANFNHRHEQMVANSPYFHSPTHLLSKAEVDRVGERIDAARPRPPKPNPVPDEAIELCQEAHTAGTGSNVKTNMQKFDVGGLAALVCRHDIPLFVTNIDTPGEQQKYAISMIERLHSMLPSNATVVVLYDIGCVVDKSVTKFEILSDDLADRTLFATAVMHSYVHQWSCQLYYSPRMKVGLGLSDGENVERLWSVLRELIGVCRKSSLNRRDFLIDRKLSHISFVNREGLGYWINNKLNDRKTGVVAQRKAAEKSLAECGVARDVLEAQWKEQKKEQLSLRAHAPARLKKELDHVLTIQGKIGELDATVSQTTTLIKQGILPAHCTDPLKALQAELIKMKDNAEEMYSSLNVNSEFPTLTGVSLTLVKKLFLLRELKASVQKRASHACFEFDKLDRAAGGKDMVLGTKMHQSVRAAMSKKNQTLTNSVTRYNEECTSILRVWPVDCQIPRPEPLPTSLTELKACTTLMESVWVSKVENEQRWVRDPDVREGIRAMHKVARCVEERRRLGKEADNMLCYYRRRLSAVAEALCDSSNADILCLLQQEYDYLLTIPSVWKNDIVGEGKYRHVRDTVNGSISEGRLTWMTTIVCEDEGTTTESTEQSEKAEDAETSAAETGLEYIFEHQAQIKDLDGNADKHCEVSFLNAEPNPIYVDETLLQLLSPRIMDLTQPLPRSVRDRNGRRLFMFDNEELRQLQSTSARLNDECINGIGSYVQTMLAASSDPSISSQASRCAVLSSHALLLVRCHTADLSLWRLTSKTEFWSKPIWILPIHRLAAEHWVLAIILPHQQKILLFDSFANAKAWERDLPDIMKLVRTLARLAQEHLFPVQLNLEVPWSAQPLTTRAVQTNGHDCGVWILACMIACLRGYHRPSLAERDIPAFRHALEEIVLGIGV